ncbi:TolC family protein [Planctomycetota bacterium]|nr:TolC family protein [Planctomycetota bacterium]
MSRRHYTFILTSICCASLLAGCSQSPFADIDWDASQIVSQQQRDILSQQAVTSRADKPDESITKFNDNTTSTKPKTNNPDAADLPVKGRGLSSDFLAEADATAAKAEPADAIHLNLEDIISYALQHSPEYKSQKESLYLEALSLITERHQWGPRFFSSINANLSGTPEAGDHELAGSLMQDLRVTQKLPYGGDVSAKALVNYVNYLRTESDSSKEDRQNASLGLSFNLPLLRGAGITARESLIQAERDMIYAVRDFERYRRQFIVDLCSSYFNLLRQQQSIENSRRRLENLEILRDRFKRLSDTGREPYFEYERAQNQVLSGKASLSNSIDSYDASLDSFKLTIGMPTIQPIVIDVADILVPEPALDTTASIQAAYEYRLDLQTKRDRVEDTRRSVNSAKNRLLPELNVSGSVNLVTNPDLNKAGFQIDAGESSYDIGANLEIPLDRVSENASYRSSLISMERAIRNYNLEEDRIAQQVRSAIRDIKQARFNIQIQEQNVKISERRLTSVKLRERTLGPREVIDALDNLNDAREDRDQAKTNLRTSILSYLLTTGQMRVSPEGRWISPGALKFNPQLPPFEEAEADAATELSTATES